LVVTLSLWLAVVLGLFCPNLLYLPRAPPPPHQQRIFNSVGNIAKNWGFRQAWGRGEGGGAERLHILEHLIIVISLILILDARRQNKIKLLFEKK
jgi:hypothetical protein